MKLIIILLIFLLIPVYAANAQSTRPPVKKAFLQAFDIFAGTGKPEIKIESKPGFEGFEKNSKYTIYGGVGLVTRFFTVEVVYSELNFELKPPSQLSSYGIDTAMSDIKIQYLSIPILYELLTVDFAQRSSDNSTRSLFQLKLSIGPSFGFRISSNEDAGLGIKNFNLGLSSKLFGMLPVSTKANITGGVQYEYGGFNNLGETQFVSKVSFSAFRFFAGVRIGL
jgi:hypothetical protein